ncbi:hypothetical protein E5353_02610 [Bacteroides caecimuris]|uniref:Uncharacterized protein n=1 Tax=Bacteroides caecimuris TaxID=1796613 RepID=A0A3A9BZY8_9BACE|nr:hypothetical protein [Bacteroides caecimuris]TGY40376.1 hypothetical protein E5353_02610 [Bacteroides caecimuris]
MIREDKTPAKKMLSTKNSIYIVLCILYLVLLMINRKYPLGDVTLHIVYLSTWFFLLLWEVVDVLINRKKNISFIVIISMVLVMYIANMLR